MSKSQRHVARMKREGAGHSSAASAEHAGNVAGKRSRDVEAPRKGEGAAACRRCRQRVQR